MMRVVCGGGGVLLLLTVHTGNSLFSPFATSHLTTCAATCHLPPD